MGLKFNIDRLALLGSIVSLFSLIPGWLTLKPNRLVAGSSLSLWESYHWILSTAITFLWIFCIFLSLYEWENKRGILKGIIANVLLFLTLLGLGLASNTLLNGQSAIARVTPGIGFWINMAGIFTVIYAVRKELYHRRIWRPFFSWIGLFVIGMLIISGWLDNLSIMKEFYSNRPRFEQELIQHIRLICIGLTAATIIGVPIGIWATRSRYAAKGIFLINSIVQTLPGLVLFGFLIAPLSILSFNFPVLREYGIRGVGVTPAIIALTIYLVLPIIRNTYVGIRHVDQEVIDAGKGMGMEPWQVFRKVEIPLSAPLILEGVRIAAVQAVEIITVAALIGAGGLGWFIFQGIGQAAPDLILLGAIPIIFLALIIDAVMRIIVNLGTPKGLGRESN